MISGVDAGVTLFDWFEVLMRYVDILFG